MDCLLVDSQMVAIVVFNVYSLGIQLKRLPIDGSPFEKSIV